MKPFPVSFFRDHPERVFVFGSNLAGIHGAGAAVWALKNVGAVRGVGFGLRGQSYALPTKDRNIQTLHLINMRPWIDRFLYECRREYKDKVFYLTPIGCGLAGYKPSQVRPLFGDNLPPNVILPPEFQ